MLPAYTQAEKDQKILNTVQFIMRGIPSDDGDDGAASGDLLLGIHIPNFYLVSIVGKDGVKWKFDGEFDSDPTTRYFKAKTSYAHMLKMGWINFVKSIHPQNLYNSHLLPTLRLLQTYIGSYEKVVAAVKRDPYLLSHGNKENIEQNFNFLVSKGVPLESISKLFYRQPRTITLNVDRMVHAFKSAKQFGFSPVDPMFVYAIDAILSMSESTMYKKTEFLKNLLGLSEEEVKSLFRRNPRCFQVSEEKMKNVANFFVNTVRVESSFLPSIPAYVQSSLDKTIVPRYNVYKILESKKLLKKGAKFTRTIKQSEKWFINNYVVKYLDRVPNLMELYHGFIKNSNTESITATTE